MRRLPPYDTLENRYANLRANPSNLGLHSPCTTSSVVSRVFHHHHHHSTFSPKEGEKGFLFADIRNPPSLPLREECERRAKGYKAGLAARGFEGSVFLRPRLRRQGFVEVKKVAKVPFAPHRRFSLFSSRVESRAVFSLFFFRFEGEGG